jgi:hypothetical protein
MSRIWKMLILPAVLTGALIGRPCAVQAQDTDMKEVLRRVKNIEGALEKILEAADQVKTEQLNTQRLKAKVNQLEEQVAKLQTQLDALRKGSPRDRTALYPPEAMDDLVKRLDRIDRFLSERFGPNARVAKAPPEVGRIVLVNRYPEEMTFIVNNETFRLAAGASHVLEGFPAGPFTYEVISPTFGQRARKTVTLTANETHRVIVE